ncbi:helix-turn-helix transcriptional regulator [Paenibacillus elgii]
MGGSMLLRREDMTKLRQARELFGMTIFELVRHIRMEKALWYMEVARLNVGEAAVSVGYSNVSNFTTTFRKHYGCNPSEYVKRINQLDVEQNRQQNGLN